MPNLILPGSSVPNNTEPMQGPQQGSEYAANRLVESSADAAARIGNELQSYGKSVNDTDQRFGEGVARSSESLAQDMARQGRQFIAEASKSLNDASYNQAIAKAQTTYNDYVNGRYNNPTDENGNPTFGSLSSDVHEAGQQIGARFGGALVGEAAQRFQDDFGHLIVNHTVSSQGKARDQQIQYSTATLRTNIDSTVNNSLKDPMNADMYYGQGVAAITRAKQSGYISAEDAQRQQQKLQSDIYVGRIEQGLDKNPVLTQQLLNTKSTAELGITEAQKVTLDHKAQVAVNSYNAQVKKQQDVQNKVVRESQISAAADVSLGIVNGSVKSTDDIVKQEQQGKITHVQSDKLQRELIHNQAHGDKQLEIQTNLTHDISQGNVLSSYSSADINKSYTASLSSDAAADKAKGGSGDITWEMKANRASLLKAPVDAFNKDVKYTLEAGKSEDVMKAVNAFNMVNEKNPIAVKSTGLQGSGIDKKTLGAIATITDMQKHTNLDPDTIINRARQAVNAPPEVIKQRTINYDSDFKMKGKSGAGTRVDRLQATNDEINSLFPETVSGVSSVVGHEGEKTGATIDPQVTSSMNHMLRDAYTITGTKTGAEEMVRAETKGQIGVSSLNGHQVFMFNPPEQHYSGQASKEEIDSQFQKEVAPIAALNKVDMKDVYIASDPKSDNAQGNPSYVLMGPNNTPLQDSKGQMARWRVGVSEIEQDRVNQNMKLQQDKNNTDSNLEGNINPFTKPSANNSDKYDKGLYFSKGRSGVNIEGAMNTTNHTTIDLIKSFEGFSSSAYWDVNAHRAGYGSDTVTRADGSIEKVGPNTVVSREDADRDLSRRSEEFAATAQRQVGESWSSLPNGAQAALTSVAYNYGSLPKDVAAAAKTGDVNAIADAVENHAGDNNGVNSGRRMKEAALIRGESGGVMAQNSSQATDPAMSLPQNALNKADMVQTGMHDNGDLVSPQVGQSLVAYTKSKVGTAYGFGSKNSSSGSVDCSGWVAENTLQAMEKVNRSQGPTYDMAQMHNIMGQDASHQIASIAKMSGFLPSYDVKRGSLPNGTLIGVAHAHTPEWAAGRPLGISHIVQVVEQNGQKYVSQSSTGGVQLTPYKEFISHYSTSSLYAVNPFSVVSNHFVANRGSDADGPSNPTNLASN